MPVRLSPLRRTNMHTHHTSRISAPPRKPLWAAALTAAVCLIGAGLTCLAVAADAKPQARTDLHGDPLPDGALVRFGTLRWRHGGPVSFVAFTPDGKALVTASQ